jgi:hypothetical protein
MFTHEAAGVQPPSPSASRDAVTIGPMFASRSWLARHIGRWLDRWGSALVMETECDDGTRLLIGLDPSSHVAITVASPAADTTWADGLVAPDDLRSLLG